MGSVSIGEATNGERSEETPRLRKSRATREQRGSCVIRDEARRTLILICPRRGEHGNLRGRCITSFFKRIVDRTRWCIPNGYSSLKRATAFPHRPNRNERNLRRETKLQSRCSFFFFFLFFFFRSLLRRLPDRSRSSLETGTVRPRPPSCSCFALCITPHPLDRSHYYSPLATATAAVATTFSLSRSGPRPNLQNSQPRRSVKRVCNKLFTDSKRRARTCTKIHAGWLLPRCLKGGREYENERQKGRQYRNEMFSAF